MAEQVNIDMAVLHKAICDNNWSTAKAIFDKYPGALTAKLTSLGATPIHVAAQFGHGEIVEELVKLIPPQSLEVVDGNGFIPLALAARYRGNTRVAEYLVNKNRNTLGISPLPVTLAYQRRGNKEMQRYLYSVTPLEYLKPEKGPEGAQLLHWCFVTGDLDVALHLLQQCQELLFATTHTGWRPITDLAAMASTFKGESQLVFWKRWIYNYINIPSTTTNFVRVDIQQEDKGERVEGLRVLRRFISIAYNLLGLKDIYELKLLHVRAIQILSLLCEKVPFLITQSDATVIISESVFCAAREGNVEFVVQVSKAYPELIVLHSSISRLNTFGYAVEYRQAEVFNLIHGLSFKDSIASTMDESGNSLLHTAGKLAPSFQLNRISGPALQMQRELQWFKEVESVVPQAYMNHLNNDSLKPKDIFKERHKDLRKDGEKWMKGTASSYSLVGALVVTIMFAAAFTVPGGNDQSSGYPIFLGKEKLFILFVISDALSLFSSTSSVLIFLGILTSRYAEEDFLKSLPTKLIIGLSTLFFSIATMMISFSATILMMLQYRSHSWTLLPVIMLASVPVTLFVLLQFPLLVQMVSSTYGPGIFERNMRLWL